MATMVRKPAPEPKGAEVDLDFLAANGEHVGDLRGLANYYGYVVKVKGDAPGYRGNRTTSGILVWVPNADPAEVR